jgi:hypothetical protein
MIPDQVKGITRTTDKGRPEPDLVRGTTRTTDRDLKNPTSSHLNISSISDSRDIM